MLTQKEFNGNEVDHCPICDTKFIKSPNATIRNNREIPMQRCPKCKEDYVLVGIIVENE